MSFSANIHDFLGGQFNPIGLAALNEKAAMLERLDNKYVIRDSALLEALPRFSEQFDVLEIKGQHAFEYETRYFDDGENSSYQHHHQGRRNRAKIRMRRYVGTPLCYVEVKLKDKRGSTIKKRLQTPAEHFGFLNVASLNFIGEMFEQQYHRPFTLNLKPTVDMRYRRITLVAKDGGERMTIDTELQFKRDSASYAVSPTVFILETKSARGNSVADRILRQLHQHPTKNCSKYCASIALLQPEMKRNRFLPAIRKLSQTPAVSGVLFQ
jgi:VTC domain